MRGASSGASPDGSSDPPIRSPADGPGEGKGSAWSRVGRVLLWILFLSYGACVLTLLVYRASGLYYWGRSGVILAFFGICVFGFGILIWALTSLPLWPRWRIAGPALLLGTLTVWADVGPVTRWSNARYLRQPELNEFASWVHGYGRISEMEDSGFHGFPYSLNGTRVRPTRASLDSLRSRSDGDRREAALLEEVLARDSIDPAALDAIRRQMRRFGFRSFRVHGDYVAFRNSRDGGLVYAAEGAAPLEPGDVVPGSRFEVGRRRGQWYFYRCCLYPEDVEDGVVADR